jgi:hypothetical protein
MKTVVQENQSTLKERTVLCVHTSLMKLQLMLENELSFSCIQEHWPFYSEKGQSSLHFCLLFKTSGGNDLQQFAVWCVL